VDVPVGFLAGTRTSVMVGGVGVFPARATAYERC
jgi:hypothetical protein